MQTATLQPSIYTPDLKESLNWASWAVPCLVLVVALWEIPPFGAPAILLALFVAWRTNEKHKRQLVTAKRKTLPTNRAEAKPDESSKQTTIQPEQFGQALTKELERKGISLEKLAVLAQLELDKTIRSLAQKGLLRDIRLSVDETGHLLGLAPKTLRNWISEGRCPLPYAKTGEDKKGRVSFGLQDILDFIAEREVSGDE